MRVETRARSRALQAIYAWDMRGRKDLDRVAGQIFDDLMVSAEERALAGALLRTLVQHDRELDEQLADVTTNWRLERLGVIERCVLRLAAAELHRGDTPPKVVLREAIRLAERYGNRDSARFVNGVLDALARRMGRL